MAGATPSAQAPQHGDVMELARSLGGKVCVEGVGLGLCMYPCMCGLGPLTLLLILNATPPTDR